MLIENLEKGNSVILEYVINDRKYDVTANVTGASNGTLLIEYVKEDKRIAEFDKKDKEKIVYNLYADDPDGKRVGWYNVSVKTMEYNNRKYAAIGTRSFNQNSAFSDRRYNERIKLENTFGKVETNDGNIYDIIICDISYNGISFYCKDEDDFLHKKLIIHIDDVVENENFKFKVRGSCIRSKMEDDQKFYGCNVGEEERQYMLYFLKKKLDIKKRISAGK